MSERAYRYRKGPGIGTDAVPSEFQDAEQDALNRLVEMLADHDDALLEKVLEDMKPTTAEIYIDMRKDLLGRRGDRGAAGRGGERERRAPAVEGIASRHADGGGDLRAQGRSKPTARRWRRCSGPCTPDTPASCPMRGSGAARSRTVSRLAARDSAASIAFRDGELSKSRDASRAMSSRWAGWMAWRPERRSRRARTPEQLPFPPAANAGLFAGDCDLGSQGRCEAQRRVAEAARGGPVADRAQDHDTGETVMHGQGEMHLISTVDRLWRRTTD